jgi:hypothetical protein
MVLLLACAMVATDFVRHPFAGAPPGSAAGGGQELTLWTAGTDAGAPPGQLARAAARTLDRPAARVRVRAVDGGVAAAVTGLLDEAAGEGADLLVVHAGTFADLERERRLAGLPDVAARAVRAERLLLRARPVALLATDPLLLAAVRRGGATPPQGARRSPGVTPPGATPPQSATPPTGAVRRSGAQLASAEAFAATLRHDADALVIGVDGGPWARNALAAVIDAVGARGRVRYRVLPADDQAAFLGRGAVDAVVGPASMLRRGGVARQLQPLATSAGGASLPSLAAIAGGSGRVAGLDRWVAVVAAPALAGARADAVSRPLRRLTASARWRRTIARLGLGAPPRDDAQLLADAHRDARELTLLADRLDRGAAGR